ncbi:MAG TPA: transporter substrate-binding domain-containing protein, partial [Gallionella sp.]|nr:transporter substrate-binding domain-containing protein [Gallionella sp.]
MNTLSGKLCVSSFANIKVIARFVLAFSFAICSLLALSESFADTAPLHHGDKQPRSTATFNKPVLTPAEHKWLNAHPVIRLGVDPSYAPYSEIDANGHLVGEVADYISIISRQLGIRFQISNPKQWAGILDAVKQHKIDVVATVVALPERKKYLSFTGIYIKTPLVLMTRSGDFSLRSPNDLAHRVVALVKGYSSTSQVLADHPDIKALLVKSPLQGLIAVATGEADAYVGAIGVNLAIARQNGIANLRIATAYKLDNGQSFAVRDDWSILARILDKALAAIPDTTKAGIQSKWVPEQIPDNHSGLPVLSPDEQRWIAAHRQIRVGLTGSDEPNEFVNKDSTPAGFVPKYLDLVSAQTGVNFKIVRGKNRADLLSQLDAGLLDMASVQASPSHIDDKHLLSVPFHNTAIAVFARRNAAFIGGMSDLKGKRVALTPGLMDQTLLRRQPGIVLITEPNPRAVLQAVLDGSADAGTLGVDTGQYLLEKYGYKKLRMVHVIAGEETSLRFAVQPDNPELLEIVDKSLAATTPEETTAIRRQVLGIAIDPGVP